jgi:spore coat protein U-like protein
MDRRFAMTSFHHLMLLKTLVFAALLSLSALVAPASANAAINNCTVSTAGIVFPAYNTVTRSAVDSTGTITVRCNGSGSENLRLTITGGNANACSPKEMLKGAAVLQYRIFQDPARTSNFCSGGNRLDITISFASGPDQTRTYTMYGRVLANQNPSWGNYSDPVLTLSLNSGGNTLDSVTFSVNGSVAPTCSVSSGTLAFGTYVSASGTLGTAAVSVNCSNGAPYQISLGGGQNLSGTIRRMARTGGGYLNYELFSDPGRVTAWGDGTALGAKVNGTGSGGAQSRTVYGRIPAGQAPNPGTYRDSVIVTVDY